MNKIVIEYPESFPAEMNMGLDPFAEEARWAMAMKLYEIGRLTSGQAASLAGFSAISLSKTLFMPAEWIPRIIFPELILGVMGGLSDEYIKQINLIFSNLNNVDAMINVAYKMKTRNGWAI